MTYRTAIVATASLLIAVQGFAQVDPELRARAIRLMEQTPLIDGHNDTPWQYRKRTSNRLGELDLASDTSQLDPPMHTDIARLRDGHVGAQFWSVYIPIGRYGGKDGDARTVIEQIDLVHRLVDRHPDHFEIARTADDIERIFRAGRIASLMGMEGGHSIENSLAVLRATYDLGVRYMTLTHSLSPTWADSATDEVRSNGLTPFGREVVREMNRLGMLVDLSHVSPKTMHDALDETEAPIIFSHSSARAVCDHPRNVPDDVLERLPDIGGVVMITFVPTFVSEPLRQWTGSRRAKRSELAAEHPDDLGRIEQEMQAWRDSNPAPRCTLADVADHVDHVRRVAGIDHVGIGGDFDGVSALPEGLEDVSKYPDLVAELLARGYTDDEVRKVLGENLLRVMRGAEAVAERLADRTASDALIEHLDGERDDAPDRGVGVRR